MYGMVGVGGMGVLMGIDMVGMEWYMYGKVGMGVVMGIDMGVVYVWHGWYGCGHGY
jgi:hypothetical protein